MAKKEKTKVLNLSLTPSEIKTLEKISKEFFGKENKSAMVRYWINKFKIEKRIILDGKTYKAIEDPDDGYRSYLKDIEITEEKISNNFPPQKVIGKMKDDEEWETNNTIQFIDVVTGKVVLEIGTDNADDYYPYCVLQLCVVIVHKNLIYEN